MKTINLLFLTLFQISLYVVICFYNLKFSIAAVDAPAQPQVDGTAPTFSKKPTIRQEDNGNTLVFHCAIVADPLPQITWYHNGVKVQDTAKYQVKT